MDFVHPQYDHDHRPRLTLAWGSWYPAVDAIRIHRATCIASTCLQCRREMEHILDRGRDAAVDLSAVDFQKLPPSSQPFVKIVPPWVSSTSLNLSHPSRQKATPKNCLSSILAPALAGIEDS